MLKLLLTGVIGLTFISAFIIIIRNKPDLWFWIFLNLFFDPGGYVYEYLGGTLIGPLHLADVCIAGMVICMIFANINWRTVFQDQLLKKFLFYFFLLALYYFIFYGGVVPFMHNDFDYSTFLVKNRRYPYSFHYFNCRICFFIKEFVLLLHYNPFCRYYLFNFVFYIISYRS